VNEVYHAKKLSSSSGIRQMPAFVISNGTRFAFRIPLLAVSLLWDFDVPAKFPLLGRNTEFGLFLTRADCTILVRMGDVFALDGSNSGRRHI
jgi:hypothetical protein